MAWVIAYVASPIPETPYIDRIMGITGTISSSISKTNAIDSAAPHTIGETCTRCIDRDRYYQAVVKYETACGIVVCTHCRSHIPDGAI
jgi:hypothetical protein